MAATEGGSALLGLETYLKNLESFQENQMGIQETQVDILKELMASRTVQNDLLKRQDRRIEQKKAWRENQKANEERSRQLELSKATPKRLKVEIILNVLNGKH